MVRVETNRRVTVNASVKSSAQGGQSIRYTLSAGAIASLVFLIALTTLAHVARAQGDRVRKLVLISGAQAADPQEFQAAQLIAQEWRKLGLEVEVRGMPRPQVSDIVWYNRDKWDVTMWRMVGRPERSDPDELGYNQFHATTRVQAFNFGVD